jgi:hypothetical protein
MATKIVYIPLDERPCNYRFPSEIFKESNIKVVVPNLSIMGNKKETANFEKLKDFILSETVDAYGLVISIDTLLYGGIVPSRLHYFSKDVLMDRLMFIKRIKENNPKIKIYAFQLIMRCPHYNSSDEEPTYYKYVGRNIFLTGY